MQLSLELHPGRWIYTVHLRSVIQYHPSLHFFFPKPCQVLPLKLEAYCVRSPPGPPALHPIRQDAVDSDEHLLIFSGQS